MDMQRIHDALNGDMEVFDLSVAERLAFAHEIVRVSVRRAAAPRVEQRAPPARYVLPEHIERLYRGTSS